MGVHTGRPTRTDEGYVGMDLHEAARIMAAAHGDQVLVSRATVESVGAGAIAGLSLDDLGEHRLKDLALPARLYQLIGEGLRDEFPPPRSLEGHSTNLPAPGSRLVGRDADLAEVRGLLDDGRRLITLTGPGGTGKTRLALQVAADALPGFPGGVFLADLSHVVDPELVAGTVAGALGLREGGGRSAEEALAAFLGERRLLLVLDNMEHVLEAAGLVGRLLRACHELVVVATSRAPLRLELETEWAVPPLQDAAAVALLAERAAQMGLPAPQGSVAAQICRRLDGLPLAIELAAARLRTMPADRLLERLERRLPVLTQGARDAPARQRTLRATIAWSHDLLGDAERAVFARCGAFGGSFTFEAAEDVCEAEIDVVEALIEHSLLRREGDRLGMLETVREYAVERLAESGAEQEVRGRHAAGTARRIADLGLGFYLGDQTAEIEEAEAELDNVRAALGWMLDGGEPDDALALAASLWVFWETRRRDEGRRWLLRALAASPRASSRATARGLLAAGHLSYFQGEAAEARPLLEQAAALSAELGDAGGQARALGRLAWLAAHAGDRGREATLLAEVLALLPAVSEPVERGDVLRFVGGSLASQGDLVGARERYEEERAVWEALGNRQRVANCLNNLGWTALLSGDLARARTLLDESLALARGAGDSFGMTLALGSRCVVALLEGEPAVAARLAAENLQRCREEGDKRLASESLVVAAAIVAEGRPEDAVRLVAAAESLGEVEEVHRDIVRSRRGPRGAGDRRGPARGAEGGRRAALAG